MSVKTTTQTQKNNTIILRKRKDDINKTETETETDTEVLRIRKRDYLKFANMNNGLLDKMYEQIGEANAEIEEQELYINDFRQIIRELEEENRRLSNEANYYKHMSKEDNKPVDFDKINNFKMNDIKFSFERLEKEKEKNREKIRKKLERKYGIRR